MFSDILPLGQLKPFGPAWMLLDEWRQIVKFIFDNPEVGVIISPELTITNHLFFHMNFGCCLDSSGWEGFSLKRCFVYFHLVKEIIFVGKDNYYESNFGNW